MSPSALFTVPALRRARDLIDLRYAEPLDVAALAREAGYSKFHFAQRSAPPASRT
jgi:AraC-like DNA-binding protein